MLSLDESLNIPEKVVQSCETEIEIDPEANIFMAPEPIRDDSPHFYLRNTGKCFNKRRGEGQRICTRHGPVADRNALSPS